MSVQGMTCAACAARVEKKLNTIDGVAATVNFATEAAIVTAPAEVTVQRLIDAVEQAGYRAEILDRGAGGASADGPQEPAERGGDADVVADLRRRLVVALVLFVPLTDLSVLLSLFPWSRFPGWQWVLIAVAAPVVVWSAWPFHAAALRNARHGSSSMDTLVSLGITAACGWSVYAMFVLDRGQGGLSFSFLLLHASGGGIYLEVAASVTTFLLAGRLYEAKARRDAGDAMRELAAAGARDACVLDADGSEHRVPVAQLREGQRFVVRPGERIAADGEVEFGQSAVDASMMTGESVPADVTEGDLVTAGTVVMTGRLVVRAVKVGRDTQLAHLVALVEQAQSQKAAIQRLADRICGIFVPAVLVASAPDAGRMAARGQPGGAGVQRRAGGADHRVPLRTWAGDPGRADGGLRPGCAARDLHHQIPGAGVLPRGGHRGAGQDRDGHHRGHGRHRRPGGRPGRAGTPCSGYAGAVEQASEHPVAAAVSAAARAELGSLPQAERFLAMPGLGARGSVDDHDVIIGREDLFAHLGMTIPADLARRIHEYEQAGCTVVLAGWDGQVRGGFAVADTVKPSAAAACRRAAEAGPAHRAADR